MGAISIQVHKGGHAGRDSAVHRTVLHEMCRCGVCGLDQGAGSVMVIVSSKEAGYLWHVPERYRTLCASCAKLPKRGSEPGVDG